MMKSKKNGYGLSKTREKLKRLKGQSSEIYT